MKNTTIFVSILCASSASFAFVSNSDSTLTPETLDDLVKQESVLNLRDLVPKLPPDMRLNFVLKHGILRKGERGHLFEKDIAQSADPNLPRAILWNEKSGFTVSYNGGVTSQTFSQRLDVLSFDRDEKKFHLNRIDFPLTEEQIRDRSVSTVQPDASCVECHGPRNRPIFSMYPDWPSFYGSDNDELKSPTSEVQKLETIDYQNFLKNTVPKHPRYSPLFDNELVKKAYGMPMWDSYPYRQDVIPSGDAVSRSFSFRPALRLGIVYNRQNADAIFEIIKGHPNYKKYAPLALHSLLQCNWNPSYPKTQKYFKDLMSSEKGENVSWVGQNTLQLNYNQIWNLFGLNTSDVDIRFSYKHEGYANTDSTINIMHPGYIGRYFNAYFDGTATIDELLAGKLLNDLSAGYPALKGKYHLRGLTQKYSKFKKRFAYDEPLFKNYDNMGLWFAMPYPAEVYLKHHREDFTPEMRTQYDAICAETVKMLASQIPK